MTADTNEDGSVDSSDGNWFERSFLVSDYVEPSANIQVRFVVSDDPNNSVTEAGVDEFSIDRVICDDGPACDGDRDGDREGSHPPS